MNLKSIFFHVGTITALVWVSYFYSPLALIPMLIFGFLTWFDGLGHMGYKWECHNYRADVVKELVDYYRNNKSKEQEPK